MEPFHGIGMSTYRKKMQRHYLVWGWNFKPSLEENLPDLRHGKIFVGYFQQTRTKDHAGTMQKETRYPHRFTYMALSHWETHSNVRT